MKPKGKSPEIVLRNGKPAAVILDIEEYRQMLERLEDVEALKALEQIRKRPLKFRRLEDFLKEYRPGEGREGSRGDLLARGKRLVPCRDPGGSSTIQASDQAGPGDSER